MQTDRTNRHHRGGAQSFRNRLIAAAGCVLVVGAIVGCGTVSQVAVDAGLAACRQAASAIANTQARQAADEACRAGFSGNLSQATKAAKQTARDACLNEARVIVDPLARQQVEALCPTVK
jgi:hypothetical protein